MSRPQAIRLGDGVALIIFHIIAYVQILSAGYNLWGVDPRILVNMPVGRNMILVVLFLLVQFLGLVGAILMLQKVRLGVVLSIFHHILLLPALVITSWGLVMMMDDRINATLLFMREPNRTDISLYWSLGWGTVFSQVTRGVPAGSTYIGINLFACACAIVLWRELKKIDAADAEYGMEMRRRQRQARRRPPEQLALPYYPQQQQQQHSQQQRMRPQQDALQPPRTPPRGGLRPPR